MEKEFAHYVVTAHPPGGVLVSTKCNFLAPDSLVREPCRQATWTKFTCNKLNMIPSKISI